MPLNKTSNTDNTILCIDLQSFMKILVPLIRLTKLKYEKSKLSSFSIINRPRKGNILLALIKEYLTLS